jgi:tyrosine-specific transport protein
MKKNRVTFIMALLVVGNLIGAGILALPIQTGGAGLLFSLLAMIVFCGAMYFSAVTLANEAVEAKTDDFNYPSLYHKYLGKFGKWLAVVTNMLILYGLLTAYLSGGAAIILGVFDISDTKGYWNLGMIFVLFIGLSGLTMCGTKIIARFNGLLMALLGATFAVIVILGVIHIKPDRELFCDVGFLPIAVPVILTSFHFHNIIPSICRHLEWDKDAVKKSMMTGMTIGFFMNLIWVAVGIGVLPLALGEHSIIYAFEHGLPATVPISKILQQPLFSVFATIFALVAICTSYVANGMGLMDFNRDLIKNSTGKSGKLLMVIITFVPPLLITIFFQNVFLKAIGVVGGVGIAVLFGILPAIVYFIKSKSSKGKLLAAIMVILFLTALCFDLLNDFGIIDSTKEIEEIKTEVKTENLN